MRIRAIVRFTTLAIVIQFAPSFAQPTKIAQESVPPQPGADVSEYIRLSTPVVKAWRDLAVGSSVYTLDSVVQARDWLRWAEIDRVWLQTGAWNIVFERGYTVFSIYPYRSAHGPQTIAYQGIVVKVNGDLSVDDLLAAIRDRSQAVKIDEYNTFGASGLSVVRRSRPAPWD
jgi:hypothetical protein